MIAPQTFHKLLGIYEVNIDLHICIYICISIAIGGTMHVIGGYVYIDFIERVRART